MYIILLFCIFISLARTECLRISFICPKTSNTTACERSSSNCNCDCSCHLTNEDTCSAICYDNESCNEVHSTHLIYFFIILAIILILISICICYKFVSNRIRYQHMEELNIINDVLPENNFEMVEVQIKSDDEDDEGI